MATVNNPQLDPNALSFRAKRAIRFLLSLALVLLAIRPASADSFQDLLARTGEQVSAVVDQFSEVKCTEQVTQEKYKRDGKVELKEESSYDYLVMFSNTAGELTLNESRLPVHQAKPGNNKKNVSLLVSNGFATLFLVFHPYYQASFEFSDLGREIVNGRSLERIQFQHVRNMRSPAALALRGREFPLELSGIAWIDPQTANLAKIVAGVDQGLDDVGIKSFRSEVDFVPVSFREVTGFPRQPLWRWKHRASTGAILTASRSTNAFP